MIDETLFTNLGAMIVVAAAVALLARPLKTPTIVAFLLAGLLVGPVTGWVELTESVELISEAGIVLLLFLVGLELRLEKIKDVGKTALLAGFAQVALTAIGGFGLCLATGFEVKEAAFLGIALTFSSTVIVIKLLDEKKDLDGVYGRIALGILLVQDLVVIVLLTILGAIDANEPIEARALGVGLGKAFAGMAALLTVVLAASKFALPRPFEWASRSAETLFIWSLGWCFAVVAAAHALHLSPETGAFLAGLSLAQLPYNHELRRRVHPLMNFFIAVFFVSLGIKMQWEGESFRFGPMILLTTFVLAGKFLILVWIIARMGHGRGTAFLAGISIAQVSEFSFVLGALGLSSGLISAGAMALMGMVGVVTMAASAFLIIYNRRLLAVVERRGWLNWLRREEAPARGSGSVEPAHTGHVIVVGMNSLGRELATRLTARGESVVAVDTDSRKLKGLSCSTLQGSVEHLSVLEDAGLRQAKLLVSALHIEDTNDLLAYRCRSFGIPCAINVLDLSMVDNLLEMDVTYLMIPKIDGIKFQKRELHRLGVVAE